MSKETREPLEQLQGTNAGRRAVVKNMLIGLGAALLVQPNGGSLAYADEIKKTTGKTIKQSAIKASTKQSTIKQPAIKQSIKQSTIKAPIKGPTIK